MKRQTIFLIGLAGLLTGGCTTHKIISRKPPQHIVIDGEYGDWQGIPLFYNQKPPFLFGVTNTTNRINLILRTNDAALIRQMFGFGFTLWLDKDKTIGLQLPGRMRRENATDFRKSQAAFSKIPFPGEKPTKNDFILIVKDSKKSFPVSEVKNLLFACGLAKGVYSLEFGMPLLYTPSTQYGVPVSDNKKIELDLELNGFFDRQRFRPGGGKGNGMRGMGRGRGGSNRKPDRKIQIEKKDIKFEVELNNNEKAEIRHK